MRLIFILLLFTFGVGVLSASAQVPGEDSLLRIVNTGRQDVQVILALITLGDLHSRVDVIKAKHYNLAAIVTSQALPDYQLQSKAYAQMVHLMYNTGQKDSALFYLGILQTLPAKVASEAERDAINSNYYSTAGLFYKITGNYNKAIEYIQLSIGLLQKKGTNQVSFAGQLLNLGNLYVRTGNYDKATAQYFSSLRIFEQAGNQYGLAYCYQGLSSAFTKLKQYPRALSYAEKAIAIKILLKDNRGVATAQSGLGAIYSGMADYPKALQYFKAALSAAAGLKLVTEQQINHFEIAKVYAATHLPALAEENFEKSRALAKQLGDTLSIASIDIELAAVRNNVQDISMLHQLENSLLVFEKEGDREHRAATLQHIAAFYRSSGQFEKAYTYLDAYKQSTDSINNNKLQLQVAVLEAQYNAEKKENEINLLKKDQALNRALLQKQRLLQIAGIALIGILVLAGLLVAARFRLRERTKELALRNRIAADLHDDIGSSLSSIHMLSQMAATQNVNAATQHMLTKMSNNVQETVENMSDIVWAVKAGGNDAQSLKSRMERHLFQVTQLKNIHSSFKGDGLDAAQLSIQQRKNLYLIFKESINNTLKYALATNITVAIDFHPPLLQMNITDDGKGFDTTFDNNGNGLKNMGERARELNGQLSIVSHPGSGTSITLACKVNTPARIFG
ncbi:MAG: tetratricopeptide repeat protein [Chitinophagaceae bacterium]